MLTEVMLMQESVSQPCFAWADTWQQQICPGSSPVPDIQTRLSGCQEANPCVRTRQHHDGVLVRGALQHIAINVSATGCLQPGVQVSIGHRNGRLHKGIGVGWVQLEGETAKVLQNHGRCVPGTGQQQHTVDNAWLMMSSSTLI